jgi:membrane protein DedA with SNARE-associated domain
VSEFIHYRWLGAAFWTLVGVYASAVVVAFWHPFWVVTLGLAYASIAITCLGFWADNAVYKRMKREQER